MPSSVLNWATPFQTLFPYKYLFPIEPRVFGCTCFVRDVRPHVSKLDPKSLKYIFFFGYSRVRKGYRCYCSSLCRNLVFADVTFLENTHFSQDPIHTSQGENDDLLVYTLVSPTLAYLSPLTKPPITQVYTQCQDPPVSSPPSAASTLYPISSDDLPIIALRKGKHQCVHQCPHFILLLHPWILSLCLTMSVKLYLTLVGIVLWWKKCKF